MDNNSESALSNFNNPLLLFLLSFLDDALVFGLSRLGLHISGLEWLYPVFVSLAAVYGVIQLLHYWQKYRQRSALISISCEEG